MFGRFTKSFMSRYLLAYQAMAEKPEEKEKESDDSSPEEDVLDTFVEQMKKNLPKPDKPESVLEELTVNGVAKYIKDGKAKSIIVMTGAGISTSAGIPDFRSPDTGIYAQMAGKYDLPDPQAIFDINYFLQHPEPFYEVTKSLTMAKLKPTPCHYFIRLLHEKGLLLRTFTQNIDTLEHAAGIPADKIVEAHGSQWTSTCLQCKKKFSLQWIKDKITEEVPVPRCDKCEGLIKPDVVFFGESLPRRFFECAKSDLYECDLLIVMGTSLVVQPFCSLVDRVGSKVPRLLVNRDKVGQKSALEKMFGMGGGLDFDDENNYRDVFYQGTCDDGCMKLAELLGWKDELKNLIEKEWRRIDKEEDERQAKLGKSQSSAKKNNQEDDSDSEETKSPRAAAPEPPRPEPESRI